MNIRIEPQLPPDDYDDSIRHLLAWADCGGGPEPDLLAGLVVSALALGVGNFDQIRNDTHLAALLQSGLAVTVEGEPK